MSDKVRSLNLSNCAALTIYEVLRQQDYPNLSKVEVQKGEEFYMTYSKKDILTSISFMLFIISFFCCFCCLFLNHFIILIFII